MRCQLAAAAAFLLAGTTLAGAAGVAPALTPVQYVYPHSSFEEIQQAIDNGGTVFFTYGRYDQLMSPPRGFNIGANGLDVDIIGLPGPGGKRPTINGGNVVFRVGTIPFLGFDGRPVSFRIENLELAEPDAAPPLFWRIGVWVTALGARSVINNCRMTIIGDISDTNHARNHSVGIWFWLVPYFGAPPPPSGASIDVTNNEVVGARIHEGLHVDSFWQLDPPFVPPRPVISNNTVAVRRLGGFPNGAGTDGATLATAVLVEGHLLDPIVTNNTIRGDARSPGATPRVESVGIGFFPANPDGDVLDNATIVGNDSHALKADFQLWLETILGSSMVARNALGPASSAGVRCAGFGNRFVNNHFYGPYPGWEAPAGGPGLLWFTSESEANSVEATKLNRPPHGLDICGQVLDETGGANEIRGGERCQAR